MAPLPSAATSLTILQSCISGGALLPSLHLQCYSRRLKLGTAHLPWCDSLILGCIDCGQVRRALALCPKLLQHSIVPSTQAFLALIRACVELKDIDECNALHDAISSSSPSERSNALLRNALIGMYVKCGSLEKAKELFDEVRVRDVVTWTTLMAGYVKSRSDEGALECFDRMKLEAIAPNSFTITCVLKACGNVGAIGRGLGIHTCINKESSIDQGQHAGKEVFVVDHEHDMKAASHKEATVPDPSKYLHTATGKKVLPQDADMDSDAGSRACIVDRGRDVRNRTGEDALIKQGHVESRDMDTSIGKEEWFVHDCNVPINVGKDFHVNISNEALPATNMVIGGVLVYMYAKCGHLEAAQKALDMMPVRDVVVWTAFIAALTQHGHGVKAINCFEEMQIEGISPNAMTFASTLKGCGTIRASEKGKEIHVEILRRGMLASDPILDSALVDMYAKCGMLAEAQMVFNRIPSPDAISWNALICGYAQSQRDEETIFYFEKMQASGIPPDAITYAAALKACGSLGAAYKGKEIFAEIAKTDFLNDHVVVGNASVDMFAKLGSSVKAREVFDILLNRNVISWTALIGGYAEHEQGREALVMYDQMQMEGICPDVITLACALQACGTSKSTKRGVHMHAQIVKDRGVLIDFSLGKALIDMYVKLGLLNKAQEIFDELPALHDALSWTSLIAGFTEHMHFEEALDCYKRMQLEGVTPDPITLAYCLKACGSIGAAERGKEMHTEIDRQGLLKTDYLLGNALVDMYAKCGMLDNARGVFHDIPIKDVVSWTALITGYAQQGQVETVLQLFDRMRKDGKKPNSITFLSVLNACSHAGLVDKGQEYFQAMVGDYGVTPTLEHCTCLVDLLGRSGQLRKAVETVQKTTSCPHIEMWLTILGACRKWGDVELGRQAFGQVIQIDEHEVSAYICMYSIYADAGMHTDANKIDEMRVKRCVKGKAGG